MGDLGVVPTVLTSTSGRWTDAGERMAETSRSLAGASTGGLAPEVQEAAGRFLRAWSGYAAESEAIARGLGRGLREVAADMTVTDLRQRTDFGRLDSRLGPAR